MAEESLYEYELVDIEFEEEQSLKVQEDCDVPVKVIYDHDGIPMGSSMAEIRKREDIIKEYLEKWGKDNPDRRIFNQKLDDYIHIKGISVIEAKEHSAKSYMSTRAVLKIEKVIQNALPVGRIQTKINDSNQSIFLYMIVMVYRNEDLGTVKLTIGVRKSDKKKIEYGISVLKPGEPLIKKNRVKNKKNAGHMSELR